MSRPSQSSEVDITENGNEDDSDKGREMLRQTSRRSRSDSNGSPHVTDSSISLYKTEPCQSFSETGYCRYGLKCRFAHGQSDIRPLARHKKYKTERCKTYAKSGFCPYGARCRFVHEESERETSRTASPAPHGTEASPFVAPAAVSSPALSPFVAPVPSASPSLPAVPLPVREPLVEATRRDSAMEAARRDSVAEGPRRDSAMESSRRDSVIVESSRRDSLIEAPRRDSLMENNRRDSLIEPPPVLPPPPSQTVHLPLRRPGSPALTPIGTPVNKPAVADMRPFDAFQTLSLSTGQDERSRRAFGFRGTHSLRIADTDTASSSLFSDFGGPAPMGPRSLSVPADHRTSSTSAYVGGLRTSSPMRMPELTRGLSLSVGHHPLDMPREDPPSLAIPSSILDSMLVKPAPLNTVSSGDSKDDCVRPTPRLVSNRSRSFDTSDHYRSQSQEEELASCSSILSHLELHNDSQPLSPSTVEPPEARFKQLPPLYPKRQSFCYDDLSTLPLSKQDEGRYDPRPKTPDIKQAANMNTIISTPPKNSPPYKPHSSPQVLSPLKAAQTPPPHGRTSRARASTSSSPSQRPLVIHHLNLENQLTGQFESLGRSKTDPRPPAKKDGRLSAFAAPFSSSPGSAPSVSSRVVSPSGYPVVRSLFTSSTSTTTAHPISPPIVMHLTPDTSSDADTESTVLSLLSSDTPSDPPTTSTFSPTTARPSPALSPFPPPFFPKSSQRTSNHKKGTLRKPE